MSTTGLYHVSPTGTPSKVRPRSDTTPPPVVDSAPTAGAANVSLFVDRPQSGYQHQQQQPTVATSRFIVYGVLGSGDGSTVLLAERDTDGSRTTAASDDCGRGGDDDESRVLKRCSALKVISKASALERRRVKRIEMEYRILTMIPPHRHIVSLVSAFQLPQAVCFELELCPRGCLRELLRVLPSYRIEAESVRRNIVAELLAALLFLHAHGVLYRDLKPENALIREDGSLCLADFDLAALTDADGNALRSAEQGSVAALLHQLSLRCDGPLAPPRSDFVGSRAGRFGVGVAGTNVESMDEESFTATSGGRSAHRRRESGNTVGSSRSEGSGMYHSQPAPVRPSASRLQPTTVAQSKSPVIAPAVTRSSGRRGSFVGTPYYMAPEVVAGDSVQTAAVDVWSLGMILFEMTYGATAFQGVSEEDTLHRIVHHERLPAPAIPALSRDLRDLLPRMLRKDPTKRITLPEVAAHPWLASVDWRTFTDRPPALVDYVGVGSVPSTTVADMMAAAEDEVHDARDATFLRASDARGGPARPTGAGGVEGVCTAASGAAATLSRISLGDSTPTTLDAYCAAAVADSGNGPAPLSEHRGAFGAETSPASNSPHSSRGSTSGSSNGRHGNAAGLGLSKDSLTAHDAFAFFEECSRHGEYERAGCGEQRRQQGIHDTFGATSGGASRVATRASGQSSRSSGIGGGDSTTRRHMVVGAELEELFASMPAIGSEGRSTS